MQKTKKPRQYWPAREAAGHQQHRSQRCGWGNGKKVLADHAILLKPHKGEKERWVQHGDKVTVKQARSARWACTAVQDRNSLIFIVNI